MSIKKLYSNELLASFEYSNIDKDYDFYYVTTSDKYIKGGASAVLAAFFVFTLGIIAGFLYTVNS